MVKMQFRGLQPGLAVAFTLTEPLPVPEVGNTLTHPQELLSTVQLHPLPAFTTTGVPPPAPGADQLIGLIEKLPGPAA